MKNKTRVLTSILFGLFQIGSIGCYSQYDQSKWRDTVDWYNFQYDITRKKAEISELEYRMYTNQHAVDVYNLHHKNSDYIFWIVVIIVLSGLFFSAIQFFITLTSVKAYYNKKKGKENKAAELSTTEAMRNTDTTQTPQAQNQSETRIKFGKGGIEISSSILGVIILAISIIFFYLYLHFVYRITSVN